MDQGFRSSIPLPIRLGPTLALIIIDTVGVVATAAAVAAVV